MLYAFSLALPGVGRRIVTTPSLPWPMTWPMFCLAQPILWFAGTLSELRYLTQKRGNSWWVVVYTGRDPLTGKKRQKTGTAKTQPRPASSKRS
jgi:hypothetical protein